MEDVNQHILYYNEKLGPDHMRLARAAGTHVGNGQHFLKGLGEHELAAEVKAYAYNEWVPELIESQAHQTVWKDFCEDVKAAASQVVETDEDDDFLPPFRPVMLQVCGCVG